MSNTSEANSVPASGSAKVLVISHSPFIYLWPVWAVGFLMAGLSYWWGAQVAFVPPGTVAQRDARIEGHSGPRDVLIAPQGVPLPEEPEGFGVKQPRYRMTISNNLGILWTLTLCLCILLIHVQLRKLSSVAVVLVAAGVILLMTFFGLWDVVVRATSFLEIHLTANSYASISVLLLLIWLFIFFVYDRQMYMVFSPGEVRVRTVIGGGEKVYDTKGLVLERHREAVFRHWLLGFGSGDLTVHTAGENPTQIEWPNVFGIEQKVAAILPMIEKREVLKAQ